MQINSLEPQKPPEDPITTDEKTGTQRSNLPRVIQAMVAPGWQSGQPNRRGVVGEALQKGSTERQGAKRYNCDLGEGGTQAGGFLKNSGEGSSRAR